MTGRIPGFFLKRSTLWIRQGKLLKAVGFEGGCPKAHLASGKSASPGQSRLTWEILLLSPPPARSYWPVGKCAKAFWSQQKVRPYRQLLAHIPSTGVLRPQVSWLELGCGGGAITQGIWRQSGGTLVGVVGVDCAAANEQAYGEIRRNSMRTPVQYCAPMRTDVHDCASV